MLYRHANVQQNILTLLMAEDIHEDFPTLLIQVELEEVIKTAISSDFKLWTHTKTGAFLLCDDDGLDDSIFVAFQVKSPLTWHIVSFKLIR
jgi:hypothetical protein